MVAATLWLWSRYRAKCIPLKPVQLSTEGRDINLFGEKYLCALKCGTSVEQDDYLDDCLI